MTGVSLECSEEESVRHAQRGPLKRASQFKSRAVAHEVSIVRVGVPVAGEIKKSKAARFVVADFDCFGENTVGYVDRDVEKADDFEVVIFKKLGDTLGVVAGVPEQRHLVVVAMARSTGRRDAAVIVAHDDREAPRVILRSKRHRGVQLLRGRIQARKVLATRWRAIRLGQHGGRLEQKQPNCDAAKRDRACRPGLVPVYHPAVVFSIHDTASASNNV